MEIPCGAVLVGSKTTKNGNAYLTLKRGNARLCVFQNEWINFKDSADYINNNRDCLLSDEKSLQCGTWQGEDVLWIKAGKNFQFLLKRSDYDELLQNAVHIDALLSCGRGSRKFYAYEVTDSNGVMVSRSGINFFQDIDACRNHAEKYAPGGTVCIIPIMLDVPSPAYLIYHIILELVKMRINELSTSKCPGCLNGLNGAMVTEFKSHATEGCMADWKVMVNLHLEEARLKLTIDDIMKSFHKICKQCDLPIHPGMFSLMHDLKEYVNITPELIIDSHCPELLKFLIRQSTF